MTPLEKANDPRPGQWLLVVQDEDGIRAANSIGLLECIASENPPSGEDSPWRLTAGRDILILPNNDAQGEEFVQVVAQQCHAAGARKIQILRLPGLPEGGNLRHWIDLHGDAAEPDSMRAEIETLAGLGKAWQPAGCDTLSLTQGQSYQPFPTENLPEPIRRFVTEGAQAIGCDSSFLALPLLTALSAAIGNTRRLQIKNSWSAPPILWSIVVGESGTAKTPAFQASLRPVYAIQEKAMASHAQEMQDFEPVHARWKKAKGIWERSKSTDEDPPKEPAPPVAKRFVVNDTTIEALVPILQENPRSVLLARDELNGWFGSFDRYAGKGEASGDSANWLSMFSAQSFVVDRKTGLPRTIHIPQAAVCICGGIQPAILQRALTREHCESGLAARFLLAYPPRVQKRWSEADLDADLQTQMAPLFERLYALSFGTDAQGERQPQRVRFAPEARERWIEHYNQHNAEQVRLSGHLASAWSKLEEYPARLALVVHYVRWANGEVPDELLLDRQSLEAGIALVDWFKREAQRVYAMLSETQSEGDDRRLVEWIDRNGGCVSAREVQQGCRWLKDSGAAEKALEKLVAEGRGTWENSPAGKRGQPTRRFRLAST